MELLTALAVGALFGLAVFQLLRRNVVRSVIGLILLGSALNLFLLSTGAYEGTAAPYVGAIRESFSVKAPTRMTAMLMPSIQPPSSAPVATSQAATAAMMILTIHLAIGSSVFSRGHGPRVRPFRPRRIPP